MSPIEMSTSTSKTTKPIRKSSIKPWRKEFAVKTGNEPLISEDYIDAGSQRLIATSIFVLIQAYKIWDIFFSHHWGPSGDYSNIFFLAKYLIMEGLFLSILPIFKIPWLTFNTHVTFLIFSILLILNFSLATISLSYISTIILGIWKTLFDREVSISGSRVRQRDVFDSSSHLSGKYIVQILPESTALLNPLKQSFCLEQTYSEISIPVRFNATNPVLIQLNRYDFNTMEISTTNYTKKQLKKLRIDTQIEKLNDNRISYYNLPINKPGLYRLAQVVDSSGLNIRLFRSDVIVPRCPSAYIFSGREKGNSHLCIGDVDLPKISVDGVPPLTVKYSKLVRNEETTYSVQSVNPENPMQQALRVSKNGYYWNGQESLNWASTQSLEIEMDTALSKTGDWVYFINEVEDALGNVVDYNKIYNNRENPKLLFSKSLGYGFEVHQRPQISFKDCSSQKPLKLKRNGVASLNAFITADSNSGPFEVKFEHLPLEDSTDSGSYYTFEKNFTNTLNQIQIKEAGIYKITSLQGQYCKGTVFEPSACLVYVPPEPAINVTFEDIEDKCAGPVGVTAEISLTGTPPFKVHYRTKKDGVVIKNQILPLSQTRETISFKPLEAGTYTYEFYRIDDSIYYNVDTRKQPGLSKNQVIKSLARAKFQNTGKKQACSGDSIELPVEIYGDPPFKLNYEIFHGSSKKTRYSESDISTNKFIIKTPALTKGGIYTVSLVSIENSKGCVTNLKEPDAIIDVSRMRPTAGFVPINDKFAIKTLEGSTVRIPTKFSGQGPWTIVYSFVDENGKERKETATMNRSNGEFINVSNRGIYTIESVRGAYCPGEITKDNKFTVEWIDRPTLSVFSPEGFNKMEKIGERHYRKQPICEQEEDVLELALAGAPPFTIYYDIFGPKSSSNQHFQVGTKYGSLSLENSKPGLYKYKFTGVSDDIYGQRELSGFEFQPILVEQTVNARPTVSFIDRGKIYKVCINHEGNSNSDGIPLSLVGKAPFAISYSIYHESTGKTDHHTVQDINENKYSLTSIYKGLGLGTHKVTLNSVTDANGCKRTAVREGEVFIHVNDVPYATPLSPRLNYCVGEHIGFSLTGLGPFEITYEFNGKVQTVTTSSPFSRLASVPGNLTLLSMSDTSNCVVKLPNDVRTIHPIPSVKISEGTTIIQDIHEGDQAEILFTFSGTPPFSFTYTRSELVGNPPKLKVVETNTVSHIYAYQYSIFTSMQGTYEAISVEDAYCSVSSDRST